MEKKDIVIVAGARTPFGKFGGSFKDLTATDLATIASKAALERSEVKPEEIDHVIFGNVLETANDAIYLARHVGLRADVPQRVPALTVNRLCGSGFQAVVTAAEQILTGQANVVLCGGTESMSQAPHVTYGLREGQKFGRPPKMEDLLWECLTDSFTGAPMAITAENLGVKYELTRDEVDGYAELTQKRWKAANDRGFFKNEIIDITLKTRKGEVVFNVDEHPRESPMSTLSALKPVFKKDGLVTAGNASGICDGAASLVVADAKWAETHNLEPIARLVGWGVSGCDPTIMGIGPVPAAKRALEMTGLSLGDMALVEVNEAFAP
ncbi:MAG: acetyl-CoA C-acyltransferase, partial [Candidatus Eremiobacteraeota bacterium]|nr:acetyl-CoA C-acyltransferase [Candidatus Eremiobacteraeota bacterium]